MILKIPCIENKCLLIPICKGKTEITCNLLFDYLNREILSVKHEGYVNYQIDRDYYNYNKSVRKIKEKVEKVFINLYRLYNNEGNVFFLDGNLYREVKKYDERRLNKNDK